jgi:hypothetical protein
MGMIILVTKHIWGKNDKIMPSAQLLLQNFFKGVDFKLNFLLFVPSVSLENQILSKLSIIETFLL